MLIIGYNSHLYTNVINPDEYWNQRLFAKIGKQLYLFLQNCIYCEKICKFYRIFFICVTMCNILKNLENFYTCLWKLVCSNWCLQLSDTYQIGPIDSLFVIFFYFVSYKKCKNRVNQCVIDLYRTINITLDTVSTYQD